MIASRLRLAPALRKVFSFEERAYLLLESQQAFVEKIEAIVDLSSEVFFRTFRAAPH